MRSVGSEDLSLVPSQSLALHRAKLSLQRIKREAWERNNPTERDTSSCWVCSAVLSALDRAPASRTDSSLGISLGIWKDLTREYACHNHAIVFPARQELTNQEVILRKAANQKLIYMQPDAYRSEAFSANDAPWEELNPHQDLLSPHIDPKTPRPRIIDAEWIDLDLLRAWFHECLEDHHDTCNSVNAELLSSSPTLILIDTRQACLVHAKTPCRYLALSYVWGHINNFLTTRATFQQLCRPQALDRLAVSGPRLPRTIDQAIKLTRALGEQYLWVDSLCIIQDGADKVDQLNAMASIFANASLTIVAAQGTNADAGFQGLRNISEPRHAQQHIAPLSPDRHLVRPSSKHVWDDSSLRPWSTRAWTFQESISSRRILQFAHNTVRWCCRKTRWSEESDSSDCLRTYFSLEQRQLMLASPQLTDSPLPELDELEALVNGFNVRGLTYPEDALSAFAGVSARLGQKFSSGLISGIPEMFFDVCLLWRPMRRTGPALRRKSSSITAELSLPSWSWAGWMTEVSWPYTWNRHRDPAGPIAMSFGDVRPFYQAEFHYLAEDGAVVPVNNSWLEYACAASDGQIPPGWSSHQVSDTELEDYGQTEPVSFFKHDEEHSAQFWFPVPCKPTPVPPRSPTILQFETTSGRFRLGETRRLMTRIYALDGSPAGTLWQHDENDDDFLKATNGPFESRRTIELVAILGCTVPKDDMIIWHPHEGYIPEAHDPCGEVSRTEDIYNVIWIHRHGDISYRKATGVIRRLVWESNVSSRVSLNLG